jgi:hypothetical protein
MAKKWLVTPLRGCAFRFQKKQLAQARPYTSSSTFLLLFVETSPLAFSCSYEPSRQALGIKDNPASLDHLQVLWPYPPMFPRSMQKLRSP